MLQLFPAIALMRRMCGEIGFGDSRQLSESASGPRDDARIDLYPDIGVEVDEVPGAVVGDCTL